MLLKKDRTEKMPLLKKARALVNRDSIIKILIITAILLIFYSIPKKYLGDTYPICLYRIIIKRKCIGCGTTRAVWSLLHFKIEEALEYNKLIVISFPLLIGCTISWIFKKNTNNASAHNSVVE
jgi:hypothetical protein